MRLVKIASSNRDEAVVAPARLTVTPGLMITPRYLGKGQFAERNDWCVTHVASGTALPFGHIKSIRRAKEIARALLGVLDWEQSLEALSGRENYDAVRKVFGYPTSLSWVS